VTRVIAAIDSSAVSGAVIEVATAIAYTLDSEPSAIHVGPGDVATPTPPDDGGVRIWNVVGSAEQVLRTVASEPDVVALVMGMRGTSGGGRPAGSVASSVITSVATTVVLVPPECPRPYSIRRVLVPLAGEPGSTAPLGTTIRVVRARDIEVIVLHVFTDASLPAFSDQPQHETDAWAREFLARYVHLPESAVRLELRVGEPSEEVLRLAEESGANMIALGWAQDLSSARATLVRPVLERSRVPVLLIPVVQADDAIRGGPARTSPPLVS
jgi:nucleotide-binding universal stress UspA family protein